MDNVCKELHEVKLELDKIKDEYRIKTELLEGLVKANDDQVVRHHEVKLQMEKLAQELSTKAEEMAQARHLYENAKYRLQETDPSFNHASLVNEKIYIDCGDKVQKLEGENRKLVSALDDATLKTSGLERQLYACCEEVAGLKVLVLGSQRKCLEAEQKIELEKALRNRDDTILKLEEEHLEIQDRLKWKTEQFEHLEEAHKLLQEQFQSIKQDRASEKMGLLQEISSLQINLDTRVRMYESLHTELKISNQALAHEESRRKALEVQLSESKLCFENVLSEFNEANSKIENLSKERDEAIAASKALGMTNVRVKEMECMVSHLEQENKELLHSVKEFQEAQIRKKKLDSSHEKLLNKFRDLEQTHSCCSLILEEREAEWNMAMEKMIGQMTRCEYDLKSKTEEINQLKMQLESSQSSIDISAEEMSIVLLVLKSEFSEVYSKMVDLKVEAFNELDKCKKMLEQSSIRQLCLKEHAALMEASAMEMRDMTVDLQKEKAQLEQECQRRGSLVSALGKESADLRAKTVHVEESLLYSQNRGKQLQVLLEHKTLEMDSLKDDIVNVQDMYKKVEEEHKLAKRALTEDIRKLSRERESLITCIEGACERVGAFHEDDAKLIGMLDKMWQHCEEGAVVGNKVGDRAKDDSFSNKGKDYNKGNLDRRCPLRELNQ